MSLRYRLFVGIIVLFSVIFISSFLFTNLIQRRSAAFLKEDIHQFFIEQLEEKRKYLIEVVQSVVANRIVEINSVLTEFSTVENLKDAFAPNKRNLEYGTWIKSSGLMLDRDDIHFVQNILDAKTVSVVSPIKQNIPQVHRIDSGSSDYIFVYPYDNEIYGEDVLIGIPLVLDFTNSDHKYVPSDGYSGISEMSYVIYDKQSLINLPVQNLRSFFENQKDNLLIQVPFFIDANLDLNDFLDRIERVQSIFKISNPPKNKNNQVIKEDLISLAASSCHQDLSCIKSNRIKYITELLSIWKLSCLVEYGFTGKQLGSNYSPKGVSFFSENENEGLSFPITSILSQEKKFDPFIFYEQHPPKVGDAPVSSTIAVFSDSSKNTVYLGNVAKIQNGKEKQERTGYLTLAFSLDSLIREFGFFHNYSVILIHNNLIVSATNTLNELSSINFSDEIVKNVLNSSSGTVDINGEKQYFINLRPIENSNFYVLLLTPFDVEFSLFIKLKNKIQDLLSQTLKQQTALILCSMVILIILVFNLSKLITRPVVALAEATKFIKSGQLDKIQIPKFNLGKNNEVQMLIDSFDEMIIGLKEKNKLKGILDKVVSQDIAEEILKTDVHLGGEERIVTIMFADIRQFTKITQDMQPIEIIKLLNSCMTMLSSVIESYHGVIDKYVGDEVMVLFGAPIERGNSVLDAIKCAIEIKNVLKNWNYQRSQNNLPEVYMGIGIHTGKVLAGNMGAENRLNYTVIGSSVNLASRLCSSAGAEEILISYETYCNESVKEKFDVEDLGEIQLKGFDQPRRVLKIKGIK